LSVISNFTKSAFPFIKLLIDNGADIHAVNKWKETPLFICGLKNGSAEIAKLLIEKGADINTQDVDGNTVLDMAKKTDNEAVLKLLTELS
jgi:ankyrin repeat protein